MTPQEYENGHNRCCDVPCCWVTTPPAELPPVLPVGTRVICWDGTFNTALSPVKINRGGWYNGVWSGYAEGQNPKDTCPWPAHRIDWSSVPINTDPATLTVQQRRSGLVIGMSLPEALIGGLAWLRKRADAVRRSER